MYILRAVYAALFLSMLAGVPVWGETITGGGTESPDDVPVEGETVVPLPIELNLALQVQPEGTAERRAVLSSGSRTGLFRDRISIDSERERVFGYESPSISAGPLQPRGYLRSIEAPVSASPVRDGVGDAGGYRLRRQGGYGSTPDLALRLPFARAYHRDSDTFVLSGGSLDMEVPVHARLFAARSVPRPVDESAQWLLDRTSPSPGPLWFTGVEVATGAVRAEFVGMGGTIAPPGWLAGAFVQQRVGRGEIRGSVQARSSQFAGADGHQPDERAVAGVRYERTRGRVIRPLVETSYYLGALEPLPASHRRDGFAGVLGTAIGPNEAFLRPRIEAAVDRGSSGEDRTRMTARLDGALGGEAVRVRAGLRRKSDTAGPGETAVSVESRASGFLAALTGGDDAAAGGRGAAGFGRPSAPAKTDAGELWTVRAGTRLRVAAFDREAGGSLSDYDASENWTAGLRGNIEAQRNGFNMALVVAGEEIPVEEFYDRLSLSAVLANLETELRIRWRTEVPRWSGNAADGYTR